MNRVRYFAFISPTFKNNLLNILMVDGQDVVLRWNPYPKCWQQTVMCKNDILNPKHPKAMELDVNYKYKFISEDLDLKWNKIVLSNTSLGREIL